MDIECIIIEIVSYYIAVGRQIFLRLVTKLAEFYFHQTDETLMQSFIFSYCVNCQKSRKYFERLLVDVLCRRAFPVQCKVTEEKNIYIHNM